MIIGLLGLLVFTLLANLWYYENRFVKTKKGLNQLDLIGWRKK